MASSCRMHSPYTNHNKAIRLRFIPRNTSKRNCLIVFIFFLSSDGNDCLSYGSKTMAGISTEGIFVCLGLELFSSVLSNSSTSQKHPTELEKFQSRQRPAPVILAQQHILKLSGKECWVRTLKTWGCLLQRMTHRVQVVTQSFPTLVLEPVFSTGTWKRKSSVLLWDEHSLWNQTKLGLSSSSITY